MKIVAIAERPQDNGGGEMSDSSGPNGCGCGCSVAVFLVLVALGAGVAWRVFKWASGVEF